MSTWGTGPFDSDPALDFLGGLADEVAAVDDDGDIVAGSVDATAAEARLRQVLRRHLVTDSSFEFAGLYVVAGLVAARLTTPDPDGTTGLDVPPGAGPDLAEAAGYLELISADGAVLLREDAAAAVRRLAQAEEWIGAWQNPQDILADLNSLHMLLNSAGLAVASCSPTPG